MGRAGSRAWRFYRTRELPRPARRDPGLDIIGDTAMTTIMAGIGQLGEKASDGPG
jgi:hypothetical protein